MMTNPFEPTHAVLVWRACEWADRAVIYEGSQAACERHVRHLRETPDRIPLYWRGAFVEVRPISYVEGVYRALVDELKTEPTGTGVLR